MAQFFSGKDLTNSSPPVLPMIPASEVSFNAVGQQGETQGDKNLDQSWTSTDLLGDSEFYDVQFNLEDSLVFPFDQETEADATLQKFGLETESCASVLVNSAYDTRNSSGRYSSGDNWSGAFDALATSGPVNHNSASASSNQSFGKPSPSSVANQNDRASHRIGSNTTVRIEGWCEPSQAQSSDVNQQREDGQVSQSIDANSVIALDDWFEASTRAQSTEVAARRVDKRKGESSPRTSDKSMSSETDGDEVLSSGSNGEGRRYDLPHRPSEGRNEADCLAPAIGMAFPSHDAAYEFYKNYASQHGFKVRKAKVQRLPDKTLKKRDFYCSKEGFRSKKENNKTTKYTRKETRTGCGARIQVEKKTIDQKEKWVISKAILVHNHPLESALDGDIRDSHGDVPKPVSVQTENEVKMPKDVPLAKCVGSSNMDRYNYSLGRQSKNIQSEDCQSLLDYFTHLQAKDPSFFYSVQVDAASRTTNFFWTDGRSRTDYEYFGDVLVLDIAFRLGGEHGRICAPFWGINHHQQVLLFGCAFLLDETEDSFIWLLKSFLEAMGRRKPKTMFTNEDRIMADAVHLVLPETQHRFDTSFVLQNALKHLPEHYEEPDFKGLLNRCIFGCQSKEEFESKWDLLVNKYNLSGNSWVQNLHTLRDKWSHLYAEKTFNAGMDSLQGIEKMRNVFEDKSREATSLSKFVQQYGKLAEELRRAEQTEDCCRNESVTLMFSRSKIEKQAAEAYTTTMFKMFQEELRRCLSIAVEKESSEGLMSTFKLVEEDDKRNCIVTFNSSDLTLKCSCGKFESIGILCVHSLRVLDRQNIFHIPEQYVLKRWRKDAKDRIKKGNHVQPFSSAAAELEHKAFSLIARSAAKEDCLKLVESYLDELAKKVEEMLKGNPDSLIEGLNH